MMPDDGWADMGLRNRCEGAVPLEIPFHIHDGARSGGDLGVDLEGDRLADCDVDH